MTIQQALLVETVNLSHYRPEQALRVPEFLENRHSNVVRLSALSTGHLYPQEISLVLSLEGLRQCRTNWYEYKYTV